VYLAEITVIKPSNRLLYKACDELCFKSKNLYNAILYIQRKNYYEIYNFIGAILIKLLLVINSKSSIKDGWL